MTETVIICKADELDPGDRILIETVRGVIGVFNIGGHYHALKNVCPHAGAEVCRGTLSGTTAVANSGELEWVNDGEILRCPWHQWEFDVRTGHTVLASKWRIATYAVSIHDGNLILHL